MGEEIPHIAINPLEFLIDCSQDIKPTAVTVRGVAKQSRRHPSAIQALQAYAGRVTYAFPTTWNKELADLFLETAELHNLIKETLSGDSVQDAIACISPLPIAYIGVHDQATGVALTDLGIPTYYTRLYGSAIVNAERIIKRPSELARVLAALLQKHT